VVQQARDQRYGAHLDLTEAWHRAWAHRWGLGYLRVDGPVAPRCWAPHWDQPFLLAELLRTEGAAIWLDADALVVDPEQDPRPELFRHWVGMARHPGPPEHWNCGVVFARNAPLVRRFFERVTDFGPGRPPWYQQEVMNVLLLKRPWDVIIGELDPRWNATRGVLEPPAPAVLAWHGQGTPGQKYAAMAVHARGIDGFSAPGEV
jgi:hypothetical protein